MLLFTHIAIALLSIVVAAVSVARPSMKLVKVVASLTAATLTSGTVLLLQGASVWHLCLSGLLFTSLTVVAMAVALRRLKFTEARQ